MSNQAKDVFEREFLPLRGKLLEVAAALDRLSRSEGDIDDPRMEQVWKALELLGQPTEGGKAEQVQMIFSLPYRPAWREEFASG